MANIRQTPPYLHVHPRWESGRWTNASRRCTGMAWHISTSMSMSTSKSMSAYSLPSVLSVSWLPLQADGDHPVPLPLACHDEGVAAVDSVSFLTLLLQFCHCAICVIMQFTLLLWHCVLHTRPLPLPGDRRAALRSAVIIAGGRHGRLGTLSMSTINQRRHSSSPSVSTQINVNRTQ